MKIFLVKLAAFFSACLSCLWLQKGFGYSPVQASALVGFTGTFYPFSKWVDKKNIHAVIYAGSFAGMCSQEYLVGPAQVFVVSVVGCCLYLCTRTRLDGFGGKLGAIAFISSLLLILSKKLW